MPSMIELGGNMKLDGFQEIDPPAMIIIKKIVGNYVKKFQEQQPSFQELILHLANNSKDNIQAQAKLSGSKEFNSQASDVNLFFAIDKALSQVMSEAKKE